MKDHHEGSRVIDRRGLKKTEFNAERRGQTLFVNIKSREAVTKSTNEPSSSSPVPVVSVMETEHTELHNLLNILAPKWQDLQATPVDNPLIYLT